MANVNRLQICEIISNDIICGNVYKITVYSRELACEAAPGQFVMVKCGGVSYLRRPLSICDAHAQSGGATFMYRAGGAGTIELAGRKPGEMLDIIGPLGRGYELKNGKSAIVGGGIGVFPLLLLAKRLGEWFGKPDVYAGFRDSGTIYLREELEKYSSSFYLATDDGSAGVPGNIADVFNSILDTGVSYDNVYACGPQQMLEALKRVCEARGLDAQVSIEQRMGCGIGACLVCACHVKPGTDLRDGITAATASAATDICEETASGTANHNYAYARVCKDGPVFRLSDLMFDEI